MSQRVNFINIDNFFTDLMYQLNYDLKAKKEKPEEIVIIEIDKDSLWIIDRPDHLADVIKAISKYSKPEVIGIDILYDKFKYPLPPEISRNDYLLDCPDEIDTVKKYPDEMKLACVINDKAIVDVILATYYFFNDKFEVEFISPLKFLKNAASYSAFVNIPKDSDNVNRKALLFIENENDRKILNNERIFYSMALAVSIYAKASDIEKIDRNTIEFNRKIIKNSSKNQDYFTVYPELLGPNYQFKYIKISEIRKNINNEDYLKNTFNNKIILIGVTADEAQDLKDTPFTKFNKDDKFNGMMPGVEYHANI
ncbi:MAG: CHASE2 domain-containing protein, partial [Cyanobacteriota bacterium]